MTIEPSSDEDQDQPGRPVHVTRRFTRVSHGVDRAVSRYRELASTRPVLAVPVRFVEQYTARQGPLLASALAFRMFLWIAPAALLLAAALAAFAVGHAQDVTEAAKAAGITGAASHEVVAALRSGHRSWFVAAIIGCVLFLRASRSLTRTLILVHAHAWQVPLTRRPQKDLLITTALLDTGWVLVLLFAASVRRFDHLLPGGVVLSGAVEAVELSAVWLALCLRLPNRRTRWADLLPGSVLFGAGMAILHTFSRVYLPGRLARSSELYGTLGTGLVILAWLLVIGQLIISAAFLNSVLAEFNEDPKHLPPPSPL